MTECRAIRFVSVPQQIARCSVPRKSLGHLAGKPALRGIGGDFEVNNPSAIEAEHNQGIKQLERRAGDYKHVNRRKVGQVIAQKAPPGGEGTLGRHGIHLPTVAWLILMPSLTSIIASMTCGQIQ